MPEPEKKPNLKLSREKIKREAPHTPQEAAEQMAEFYNTLGNCLLNLVAIQNDIAKSMREISGDTSFILENMDKQGLHEGWLTEEDIEARDEDDGPETPQNAE